MQTIYFLLVINILFVLLILKYFKWLKCNLAKLNKLVAGKFAKLLIVFANRIRDLSEFLSKKSDVSNAQLYRSLTAYADPEKSAVYIDVLLERVKDPETKNIALTGPYGSGKSSIIKSFQQKHPEYRFLHISLASFRENGSQATPKKSGDDGNGPNSQGRIESVEFSILQQIFYHVKHQQIPFSRFKRIKNQPRYILMWRSIYFVTWAGALAYLIWHEKLFTGTDQLNKFFKSALTNYHFYLSLYALLGTVWIIYLILRLYNNSRFHKLNLTSGEVEISPDTESSILNQHLDELIYFFEATRYNVLIIEDLDRFDDPEIFTRLRELNTLINSSRQIGRKVTFIYALGDDVFKDETRTKFFDFIVPVIPIIDNNNSQEQLRKRLKETGVSLDDIPDEFISDISFYIDDMRLLLNTINEFQIYRQKLRNTPESYVYLLAMMTFKNKYPQLFAGLHKRKGLAFKILSNKEKYIKELSGALIEERDKLKAQIENVQQTYLRDVDELRTVYIYKLIEALQNFGGTFYINNIDYKPQAVKEEGVFRAFLNFQNVTYWTSRGDRQQVTRMVKDPEKAIDGNNTYSQRETAINEKQALVLNQLTASLRNVEASLAEIRQYNLQDIFRRKSLASFVPEIKDNGLLNYLFVNGYLNENYHYYLSYFYEGSLTRRDMDFFFSVKEQNPLPFDYRLEKTLQLIGRLQLRDFDTIYVFNNDLLAYLLSFNGFPEHLDKMLSRLGDNLPSSIEFIGQYLQKGAHLGDFLGKLAGCWKNLWGWIKLNASIPDEQRKLLLLLMLEHSKPEHLSLQDQRRVLARDIEQMPDFLNWTDQVIPDKKVEQILTTLNIKFQILDNSPNRSELFNYVYQHQHYQLNPAMLMHVFKTAERPDAALLDKFIHANLTTIRNGKQNLLEKYVEERLSEYLDKVFFEIDENIQESEETILYLLTHPEVSVAQKEKVLERQTTRIDDIAKIPDDLKVQAVRHSRVAPTWANVAAYFDEQKALNPELISFLNEPANFNELSQHKFEDAGFKEEEIEPLAEAMLFDSDISDESLSKLLLAYSFYINKANFEGISRERAQIMLELNTFSFNKDILYDIKSLYPGLQILYFERHVETLLKRVAATRLDSEDYRLLFLSKKLSNDQKAQLIDNLDFGLLGRDPAMAVALGKLLEVEGFKNDVPPGVLFGILTYGNDTDLNKHLLLKYIDYYDKENVGYLLKNMGGKFEELSRYKDPRFNDEPITRRILTKLKDKEFFVSSMPTKGTSIYVYSRKKDKKLKAA